MISDSVISCVEKEEKKSMKTMKNDKRKRRGRKWGDFMTKEKMIALFRTIGMKKLVHNFVSTF